MAHSHQQTLLSRLGFSDPDHKDPRHTLACEYLCKPEVAIKVAKVLGYQTSPLPLLPNTIVPIDTQRPNLKEFWVSGITPRVEVPVISEGYKSKSYIGFIDVSMLLHTTTLEWEHIAINFKTEEIEDERYCMISGTSSYCAYCSEGSNTFPKDGYRAHVLKKAKYLQESNVFKCSYAEGCRRVVVIEVKTNRCDPADIIKQLKLYHEYTPSSNRVIATCYPVSQSTKDLFKQEGVHHIFLGAGFEEYCKARRSEHVVSEEGL